MFGKHLIVLIGPALALTACGGGAAPAVQTAAVETVSAVMTSAIASLTPEPAVPLPQPSETPLPPDPTASVEILPNAPALPDPSGYTWMPVAGDFDRPLDVQSAGDDRLFVVEQAGRIWTIEDGRRTEVPFLDIRGQVGSQGNEQGLLGLAFHPRFQENGRFFVNYTDLSGDTVVARFNLSPESGRAVPSSETRLMAIDQPYANHNGGGLAFGPDGYLYVGTGDGGSGGDPLGNGQSLNTLLGKMLRLDVDGDEPYAIPPDNPYAGSGEVYGEIWAFGLRNPWRFAFDLATGDLYIGDVGQGSWEEIDVQPASSRGGENYGWNLREGAHPFAGGAGVGLVDPVAEYGHDLGCSVTGGVVVRDPQLPEWQGVYLYGDYCSGRVWGLLAIPDTGWDQRLLFETDFNISAFGQDAAKGVILVDQRGGIYRLSSAR